jgi:polyisoprenoid-binding protein YceI
MKTFLFTALFAFAASASVDLKKSEFKWTGTKVTGAHNGTAPLQNAKIVEENGALKGGEFVINLDAMTVTDLTGDSAGKLIGHLKSPDFFDTATHPTAKLVVKSVQGNKVTGDLTIKGVTLANTFDVKKDGNAYVGKLTFDRAKYGLKYNSKSFFDVKTLGDKVINDEVVVDFKVVKQ